MPVSVAYLRKLSIAQVAIVGLFFSVHADMVLCVADFCEFHRAKEAYESLSLT